MTWTGWLITIPGLCYLAAAVVYGLQRQWPLSITFAGYCLGNVGLWLADNMLAKQ